MITNEIYFFKNQSSVSISDSLYNVNDGVLILQVDGNASNLELSVLGNTDLIDDDFVTLKTINATDYSMSDKITSTGIYWIDINGIRKVKLNLSKITGSVNVKALTKRGLTTDLVARAMAANSQSGGCSLEEVKAITGELDNLSTEDKTNLVNAINEVASNSGGDNNDVSIYTWIYNGFPNYNSHSIKDEHGTFFQDIINDAYTKGKKGIIVIKTSNSGSGLNIDNQYALTATNCNLQLQPTVIAFFGNPVSMDTNIYQRMNFQWARVRAGGTWDNGVFTLNYLYWDGVKNISFLPTTNKWNYNPTENYHPATKKYVDDAVATKQDILTYSMYLDGSNVTDTEKLQVASDLINNLYKSGSNNSFILHNLYSDIFTSDSYDSNLFMNGAYPITNTKGTFKFMSINNSTTNDYEPCIRGHILYIYGTWTNDVFTANRMSLIRSTHDLSLSKLNSSFLNRNNTTSYTPTGDYNPATKKYVDDTITAAITTSLEASY